MNRKVREMVLRAGSLLYMLAFAAAGFIAGALLPSWAVWTILGGIAIMFILRPLFDGKGR